MNLRTSLILKRAVQKAGFPDILNLYLFGINGTEMSRLTRRRQSSRNLQGPAETERRRTGYKEINAAVNDWAERNASSRPDFRIEDISKDTGISRRTLFRYFEDYLETDFRLWRNRLRIRTAQALLLTSELSINEISRQIGFKDKSNFHRQFKSLAGCTPGQWKNSGGHPEIRE